MLTKYTRLRAKELSRKASNAAKTRWARDAERRKAEEPENLRRLAEVRAVNLPNSEGDVLGTLQWTEAGTGKVRRWVVRRGDRADRVTLEFPGGKPTRSHGWTWVMSQLRRCMVGKF